MATPTPSEKPRHRSPADPDLPPTGRAVHPAGTGRHTAPDRPGSASPSAPDPAPAPGGAPTGGQGVDLTVGWEIAGLYAAGVLDAIPGDPPVPISVWRAVGPEDPPVDADAVFTGLTPRLAATLLAVYTDPGEMIIDGTHDATVQTAAQAAGRHYLPRDLPLPAPEQADLAGRVALVLLRWPAPDTSTQPAPDAHTGGETPRPDRFLGAVLAGCRSLLAGEGHTVILLAPPVGTYRDHARVVIPAARAAGLGYLQHVVVITTPLEHTPTADQARAVTIGSRLLAREHLDLLVFILRPTHSPAGRE